MYVIGIDPGDVESALCVYDNIDNKLVEFFKRPNDHVLLWLDCTLHKYMPMCHIGIEQVKSYGMPMGDTTIQTEHWAGRFHQAALKEFRSIPIHQMPRKTIVTHLCGSVRAKDSHVRQRMIDIFGAPGTKKKPGKTYGISNDIWSALAIAVACYDIHVKPEIAKACF